MDTNKMREQFESFAREVLDWSDDEFRLASDGKSYYWAATGEAWVFWQASREAVVVELQEPDLPEAYIDEPVDRDSEEFRYLEARHGAQYQTYRKCRQAIEAQGLKVEVKP